MKKLIIRIVSLIMVLSAITFSLFGCSKDVSPSNPDSKEDLINPFTPSSEAPENWIAKYGDIYIGEDVFKYYFEYAKLKFGAEGNMDEQQLNENLAVIKEYAINKAIEDLSPAYIACELGIGFTQEEYDEITASVPKTSSEYETGIMTYELKLLMSRVDKLKEKLKDYYTGDNGIYKITDDNYEERINQTYAFVEYIAVKNDSDGSSENETAAQAIREKLASGATFEEMFNEYSSVCRQKNSEELVSKIDVPEEVEKVLFDAKIGTLSDVIKTSDSGYIIFLKKEIDKSLLETRKDDFIKDYNTVIYKYQIQNYCKKIGENSAVSDLFNSVKIDSYSK